MPGSYKAGDTAACLEEAMTIWYADDCADDLRFIALLKTRLYEHYIPIDVSDDFVERYRRNLDEFCACQQHLREAIGRQEGKKS